MNHPSESISPNPLCQLQIFTHNRNSLSMNRTEIRILEQRNHVSLCCLLQGKYCLTLETYLLLELSCNLPHQSLKRQLSYQKLGLYRIILTLFWYFLISRNAIVPGLNLCGFFTPGGVGAVFLAILAAMSCFLGTFCAEVFLAVCFVLAIVSQSSNRVEAIRQNAYKSRQGMCEISTMILLGYFN